MSYYAGRQFPKFVRDVRRTLGMTQNEMCDALGVNTQQLSQWENGRCTPQRHNIDLIVSLLRKNCDSSR